jgi:hypothetical protein
MISPTISALKRLLAMALCLLLTGMAVAQDQVSPPPPQDQQSSPSRPFDRQEQEDKASQDILKGSHLPDSAGSAKSIEELPPAPQAGIQALSQEPTGTAAAPAGKITGSAASQPAGVAIAPAKQRQVRSILIKVGALAGAGIALGTVYGLSKASPSTPPGSH